MGGGLEGMGFVALVLPLPQEVHSNATGSTSAALTRTSFRGVHASFHTRAQTSRYATNFARPSTSRSGGANRRSLTGVKKERAVVVSVTLAVAGSLPSRVTCDGEIEQLLAAGAPLQLNVTVPLNPPTGVTDVVKLADCPAAMETSDGAAEIAKSALPPPPEDNAWRASTRFSRPFPRSGPTTSALAIALAAAECVMPACLFTSKEAPPETNGALNEVP